MKMIIFVGNIGTGKSLIASKLAKNGAVVVNMDTIQAMVAGGDYGKYDYAKKDVYHSIETAAIESALRNGHDVVIDRTNMDKKRRKRFIEIAQQYTDEIVCFHFGIGDKEKSLGRRMKNPRGVSQETWASVFDKMVESYDPPTTEEGFSKIEDWHHKFHSFAFDFDGCIVENKFPEIGEIIPETVQKMKELSSHAHNIVIVWTCRSENDEHQMREFLNKSNIPFDAINENPVFETGSRKLFAHEYYDDRNACV